MGKSTYAIIGFVWLNGATVYVSHTLTHRVAMTYVVPNSTLICNSSVIPEFDPPEANSSLWL